MKEFNLKEVNKLIKQNEWNIIVKEYKLPEKFIEKYKDKIDWFLIAIHQELSEKFIEKYHDKFDWYIVSWRQKLSEKFIIKHIDKMNIHNLLSNQKIKFTKNLLKFLLFKAKSPYESKVVFERLELLRSRKNQILKGPENERI